MYERNFSPVGIALFIALALAGLAVLKADDVGSLWARAVDIGDRAIDGISHKAKDTGYAVRQRQDEVSQRVSDLQNGNPSERRYAAWALGELESDDAVNALIEALGDGDADVRLVSAWALGEIKDYDAIDPLIELLDDGDPLVREMAVIERSTAIDPIVDAAARHPELAEPAIWALGEIGGRQANEARDELFAQIGQRGWDNEQVWSGRLGTREARSMSDDMSGLTDALGDSDAEMRASAAEWLGKADDERSVEALLDALRDPDPAVRAMAIWALDETNPSRQHSQTRTHLLNDQEYDDHELDYRPGYSV
jgi:hypothetical protein